MNAGVARSHAGVSAPAPSGTRRRSPTGNGAKTAAGARTQENLDDSDARRLRPTRNAWRRCANTFGRNCRDGGSGRAQRESPPISPLVRTGLATETYASQGEARTQLEDLLILAAP